MAIPKANLCLRPTVCITRLQSKQIDSLYTKLDAEAEYDQQVTVVSHSIDNMWLACRLTFAKFPG